MDRLISEQAVIDAICKVCAVEVKPSECRYRKGLFGGCKEYEAIKAIPLAEPKKCKDCKYFEYDSVAKVDGIPLIVAHEICNKWGGGCRTSEDGYCFLFEPQKGTNE